MRHQFVFPVRNSWLFPMNSSSARAIAYRRAKDDEPLEYLMNVLRRFCSCMPCASCVRIKAKAFVN